MASPLSLIQKALKKLAPDAIEPAMERAELLASRTPLIDRISPSTVARAVAFKPAAQRGFSESAVSTRPPVATALIRPSDWASRTPALDEIRDKNIIEYLKQSIAKEKLRDLPLLWVDEYPTHMDAGYEGRHRMRALQELYGDEPVPVNIVRGNRYDMVQTPYYPEPVREYRDEMKLPPLDMLKQKIMFGDKPIDLKPLWMKD